MPTELAPETAAFYALSTDRALAKTAKRGIEVATVIDVGASNGSWSAVCERHYPDAQYLLVEAQEVHREALVRYCSDRAKASFVLAAAGDARGSVFFDDSSPFGGVASKAKTSFARSELMQTTLDFEVQQRNLPPPYLVKLDTHGYEVPILKGANAHVLPHANLLVIEVYNFRILDDSLIFDEIVRYMRELGFGVFDISEPLWRSRDGAFWQMDFIFVPLSRPEFQINTYA